MKDWKTLPEFKEFCRAPQQSEEQYLRNKAIYIAISLGARQSDIAIAYSITSARVDAIVRYVRGRVENRDRSKPALPTFRDFDSNREKDRYERNKAMYLAYGRGVTIEALAEQWGLAKSTVKGIIFRLKDRFKTLILVACLAAAMPAQADTIKAPSITTAQGETVTPLELIGEVRDKRSHWYTPRLGKKYYVYRIAESNMHYLSDEKLRVVFDKRSFPTKHPVIYGSWEFGKAAAVGAISTGVWRN